MHEPKVTCPAKTGDRVGVTYREEHGHRGTVLAVNDLRAWGPTWTQEQVDEHIRTWVNPRGGFGSTPVAWDFGKVYWERNDAFLPTDETLILDDGQHRIVLDGFGFRVTLAGRTADHPMCCNRVSTREQANAWLGYAKGGTQCFA